MIFITLFLRRFITLINCNIQKKYTKNCKWHTLKSYTCRIGYSISINKWDYHVFKNTPKSEISAEQRYADRLKIGKKSITIRSSSRVLAFRRSVYTARRLYTSRRRDSLYATPKRIHPTVVNRPFSPRFYISCTFFWVAVAAFRALCFSSPHRSQALHLNFSPSQALISHRHLCIKSSDLFGCAPSTLWVSRRTAVPASERERERK